MSEFWYNAVEIQNPDIKTISCQAVYDQADASVMYTRMVYRVQGVVKTDNTYSMAQNLVYLRQTLMVPRRGLKVIIGGDVINIGDGDAVESFDDVGGPKPRRCDFTEIIGTAFAFVVFEIEVGVQEGCETSGDILSHTYTVAHDYDSRFYATRTIHGTIRVSNNATPPGDNADALRGLGVPDLPKGFQRQSMAFLLSADGLSLDYTIKDQELFRVAPPSATEARATFQVQMSNYIWYSHFTMELKGNKTQDQLAMFNDIFKVASTRIDFTDPSTFIQQASIDEDLYDNVIRFQITVMSPVDKVGDGINALIPSKCQIFTAIPDDGKNANAVLGPYGSAMFMAAKTAFFNPCINAPDFSFAQDPGPDETPETGDGSNAPQPAPAQATGTGILSAAQKANPYTKWTQTIEYEQHNGSVILPSTAGLAGKVYQLHSPYMIMRQYGEAVRVGVPVVPPSPQNFYSYPGVTNIKRFSPLAPVPMPDKKTLTFAASWHYETLIPFSDGALFVDDTGQQELIDTRAGDSSHPFPLPRNAALTFDPYSAAMMMKIDAPIYYDPVDTGLPPDGSGLA